MKTKQVKKQEAQERNKTWNLFSDAQKLTFLANRPGKCAKQIARILNK